MSKKLKIIYVYVVLWCSELHTNFMLNIYAIFIRCYHDMFTIDIYIELVKYK